MHPLPNSPAPPTLAPSSRRIQPRKPLHRRLQPVPLIVRGALALDAVEGVDDPALLAEVLLALVQQIPVDKNQVPRLDLPGNVLLARHTGGLLVLAIRRARREPRARIVGHLGAGVPGAAHEALGYWRPLSGEGKGRSVCVPRSESVNLLRGRRAERKGRSAYLVTPRQETETPVLERRVFERVPEAYGAGCLGVEERAVLVAWYGAADFGLLADDHGLQAARVFEAHYIYLLG